MYKNNFIIDIKEDFSILPQGRFYRDSPDCAEALYMMITEALEHRHHVEVRFNGLLQVGSNFLGHLSWMIVNSNLTEKVTVTSDDDWILRRYNKYFNNYYEEWRYN